MFLLTFDGENKLLDALTKGNKITIQKAVFGLDETTSPEDLPTLKVIHNVKYETDKLTVRTITKGDKTYLWILAFLPIDVGGFEYNIVGFFDTDNTLLIVGKVPKRYKPTLSESILSQTALEASFIDAWITVSGVSSVPVEEVVNNTSAFVSAPTFQAHIDDADPHPKLREELEQRIPEYKETEPDNPEAGKIWVTKNNTYVYTGNQWVELPISKLQNFDPRLYLRTDSTAVITGQYIFETPPIIKGDSNTVSNINADKVDGFDASQVPRPNTIPVAKDTSEIDERWLPTLLIREYTFDKPFQLTANAQNQLIKGLNADKVDGAEPSIDPTANAIVQANDQGKISENWLPTILTQIYTFKALPQLDDSIKGQLVEGLNADKVDGAEPATTPTANAIVQADAQGKISENWLPTILTQTYTFKTLPQLDDSIKGQLVKGLNADKVDGAEPATTPTANAIVQADAQGKISENWLPTILTQTYTFKTLPQLDDSIKGQLVKGLNADKVDGAEPSIDPTAGAIVQADDQGKISENWLPTTLEQTYTFKALPQLDDSVKGQLVKGLNADKVDGAEPSIDPTANAIVQADDQGKISENWLPTTLEQTYTFKALPQLDDSVKGQLVEGLNADKVDGAEPSIDPTAGAIVQADDQGKISENWLPTTLEQTYTFKALPQLDDSVKGQLVKGLNADKVDGAEPSIDPTANAIVQADDQGKISENWLPTTLEQTYTFKALPQLDDSVKGQLVKGLNADKVDGAEPATTPTANALVQADDQGKISENWLPTILTQTYTFKTLPQLDDSIKGQLVEGLNADKVDGAEPATTPTANAIVQADDQGKISENWLPTTLEQTYTFKALPQLDDSVKGQLVEGLNADKVDGAEPSIDPTAGAIVQADDQGKIAEGWLPTTLSTARDYRFALQTATADTTVEDGTMVVLANAADNAITVTLPTPVTGRVVIVKKIDSSENAVTVVPADSENTTIDGQSSVTLSAQYEKVTLISDGTNWFII